MLICTVILPTVIGWESAITRFLFSGRRLVRTLVDRQVLGSGGRLVDRQVLVSGGRLVDRQVLVSGGRLVERQVLGSGGRLVKASSGFWRKAS